MPGGASRKHVYVLDITPGGLGRPSFRILILAPIFFLKSADCAAEVCGQFEKGDIITEVNGTNLDGATHHDAVRVLKEVNARIRRLAVC